MNKYKSNLRYGFKYFNQLHRVMKNEGRWIMLGKLPIYISNNW